MKQQTIAAVILTCAMSLLSFAAFSGNTNYAAEREKKAPAAEAQMHVGTDGKEADSYAQP